MMNEKEKLYDTLLQQGRPCGRNGYMCMVWAGTCTKRKWRRFAKRINSTWICRCQRNIRKPSKECWSPRNRRGLLAEAKKK